MKQYAIKHSDPLRSQWWSFYGWAPREDAALFFGSYDEAEHFRDRNAQTKGHEVVTAGEMPEAQAERSVYVEYNPFVPGRAK